MKKVGNSSVRKTPGRRLQQRQSTSSDARAHLESKENSAEANHNISGVRQTDPLRESAGYYRSLANAIPQLVSVASAHGQLLFCNERWHEYSGLTSDEISSAALTRLIHPDDVKLSSRRCAEAMESGGDCEFEHRLRRASDGAWRWHLVHLTPMRDSAGNLTRWIAVATDIHERRQAEEDRARLLAKFETERARLRLQYSIVRADAQSRSLEEAAPRILEAFGSSLGWDLGALWRVEDEHLRLIHTWHALDFHPSSFISKTRNLSLKRGEGLLGHVWLKGKPIWIQDISTASSSIKLFRRKEAAEDGIHAGFSFPISFRGHVLGVVEFYSRAIIEADKELLQVVAAIGSQIGQFIQRSEAERALKRTHAELENQVRRRTAALRRANRDLYAENCERRRLEHELLSVTERERRRFGQDVHDGLCQRLAGIALMAKTLGKNLHKIGAAEAGEADRIAELISAATGEARDLARGLHPIEIEASGLVPALQELGTHVNGGIRCRVECDRRIPPLASKREVALNLYRIAQEAVQNAIKHAHPRHIVISFRRVDESLVLAVEDDGAGLPDEPQRRGMGLHLMNYRSSAIGGELKVEKRRPRGTRVACTLPLVQSKQVTR